MNSDSVIVFFLSDFGLLKVYQSFFFSQYSARFSPSFGFPVFLELLCGLVLATMVSSSENSLFNIKRLDGTNFPFWKE